MPGPLNAPPSFVDTAGRTIVFVKISQADYDLTFTNAGGTASATVVSDIHFTTYETGYPVVDLYLKDAQVITSVILDGQTLGGTPTAEVPSPGAVTSFRILTPPQPVAAGNHVVKITHTLREGVKAASGGGVFCFFEMSDREEPGLLAHQRRPFLERYLPCNLEFDQHPVTCHVKVNSGPPHKLMTNDQSFSAAPGGNEWFVAYPAMYTCSSLFFLIAPSDQIVTHPFTASTERKTVNVTVFSTDPAVIPAEFQMPTVAAFVKMANAGFPDFPFSRLLLYATPDKGMEYVGAAAVSKGSLEHELVHEYVGRCLLPVNGDAGWFDEGVASWFEFGSLEHSFPPGDSTDMGERSVYQRVTNRRAWTQGKVMLSYLHGQLDSPELGGVAGLIRHLIEVRQLAFVPLTARQYQQEVEAFAQRSFAQEFDWAVYTPTDES